MIFAIIAALAKAWPFLVLIVAAAVAFDAAAYALARYRGNDLPMPTLRVTRKLLAAARFPLRAGWRWIRALLGFPYVEPIRVASVGELLMLTSTEFEEAIAQSLRDRGYRHVHRRGGPGDLGVDITCFDPNGEQLAIQCKRYAPGNLVGSREIQLFIGMVHTEHDVDRGVYVTTSGFTGPARDLAERHGIRLMGGYELARTFGFDGPPLPPRFRPAREHVVTEAAPDDTDPYVDAHPYVAAESAPDYADPFFCPMTEEELRQFEDLVTTLGVQLVIEVVRPLTSDGRRGIRFGSVDEMHRAADLMEKAAAGYEAEHSSDGGDLSGGGIRYRRRAQNALIVQMLRNGGDRTFELPQLPPSP